MVSFNTEALNSGANLPLENLFIKFDVPIVTFKNLPKMAVLIKRASKNYGHGKGRQCFELCTNVYLMHFCEMTGTK